MSEAAHENNTRYLAWPARNGAIDSSANRHVMSPSRPPPPPPGLSQKGVSTQWAPEVSSAGFNPSDVDVQSKKFEFIDIISAVPLNNVLCCMPYSPQSYTLVCLKKK
jgi:hypothetical protein